MALRRCPECDQEISTRASTCPHCGKRFTTLTSVVVGTALGLLIVYWLLSIAARHGANF